VVSGWTAGRLVLHVRPRAKIDSQLRQDTNPLRYLDCSPLAGRVGWGMMLR
jgi:hypothetical protein